MHKIIHCLCLVAGIIIGFHLFLLFGDTEPNGAKVSPVFVNPAVMQQAAAGREAAYVHLVDSLAALNRQLSAKVTTTKKTLSAVRQQNKALQEQVYDIMSDYSSTTDTTEQLAHCDSLQMTVQELIMADKEKDSLYEDLTESLSHQVTIKDSVIMAQHDLYRELSTSFDSLALQQQPLLEQNIQLQQVIKKQRKKGKWLSTGALILGGIAVYGLIQR